MNDVHNLQYPCGVRLFSRYIKKPFLCKQRKHNAAAADDDNAVTIKKESTEKDAYFKGKALVIRSHRAQMMQIVRFEMEKNPTCINVSKIDYFIYK